VPGEQTDERMADCQNTTRTSIGDLAMACGTILQGVIRAASGFVI
jgi:hypothetical protein